MPKMNAGNRLYLYQLFSREIGVGRQERPEAYEDVLAADGLTVQDLGFESVTDLMGSLDEFCKLTVFKGGRVFCTITANDEFDQALAKTGGSSGKQAQGKSFKRHKGVKAARPIKPRHHEAPKPAEPEPEADAEPEDAVAPNGDAAAAEAAAKDEADKAVAETGDAAAEAEPAEAEAASTEDGAASGPVPADEAAEAEPATTARTTMANADAETATPAPAASQPEADGAAPQDEAGQEAARTEAPRHHITLNITYDPYEGLDEEIDRARAEGEKNAASKADAEGSGPAATPEGTPSPAPEPVGPAEAPARPAEAAPVPDGPAPQAPAAVTPPQPAPLPLTPAEDPEGRRLVSLRSSHPRRLSSDVRISNEVLDQLYAVLPFEIEPLEELDRSWRRARATGLLYGSGGRVTFALGLLKADGRGPATATIKHVSKTSSGKSWDLAALDFGMPAAADDGSGAASAPHHLEPLGADTALLDSLASLICIGTWDDAARLLADALPSATPAALRGCLPAVAAAVIRQHALAVASDGSRAAFSLGSAAATSASGDGNAAPLYVLLDKREGDDIPWTLAGFAREGDGRLSAFDELPPAPVLDPTLRLA